MSGWLTRAKEALSGREAEVPLEPVEVSCPCGRKIEATRSATFQRVLCQACGEGFFLLPIDVYPRPVMKLPKAKSAKANDSAKSKPSEKSATNPDAKSVTARAEPRIDVAAKGREVLGQARAKFTALRVTAFSLLAVIGLTGWWQWNRSARSAAEVEFKVAVEAGTSALRKPDFVEAAQQFVRAAAAADLLQRSDPPAEQARQKARQLTALNNRLKRSLFELIDAARATRTRENAAAAESEFASLHAGFWLVMQSDIAPVAAESNASSANVAAPWEQRIEIFDEPLILTGQLPVFAKIPATTTLLADPTADSSDKSVPVSVSALNDLGQREVVFAAQAESLKWDAGQSAWVLSLKSATAFLWSDYELLLAAGLPPDELHTEARLRAMLSEQSRWIGAGE